MAYDVDHQDENHRDPDIQLDRAMISEGPGGIEYENAGLEYKDGISHQQEDLAHGIALVAVMEGAVVLIGDDAPQVADEVALDIDDEDQEEEAEQEEEYLETAGNIGRFWSILLCGRSRS